MHFSVLEHDKLIDTVLGPILQRTFKKLWSAKDWYGSKKEIPPVLWKGY